MTEYKTISINHSVTVEVNLYPDDLKKYGKAVFVKVVKDFFETGVKIYYLQGFNIKYKNVVSPKDTEVWIYRWADDIGDRSPPIIFKRK